MYLFFPQRSAISRGPRRQLPVSSRLCLLWFRRPSWASPRLVEDPAQEKAKSAALHSGFGFEGPIFSASQHAGAQHINFSSGSWTRSSTKELVQILRTRHVLGLPLLSRWACTGPWCRPHRTRRAWQAQEPTATDFHCQAKPRGGPAGPTGPLGPTFEFQVSEQAFLQMCLRLKRLVQRLGQQDLLFVSRTGRIVEQA